MDRHGTCDRLQTYTTLKQASPIIGIRPYVLLIFLIYFAHRIIHTVMIPEVVQKLVPVVDWTPRPLMYAPSLIGQYVRIDPLDVTRDAPLLWDALGGKGDDSTGINERLKWFGMPDLKEEKDLFDLLQQIEEPPGCCVNVFRMLDHDTNSNLLEDSTVTGMACYIGTRPEHGSTEVGFVSHGLAMAQTPAATEAHYLLAKHAFETMGYRRYEWKCNSQNLPSGASALRYGFSYEGCFRQHVVTANGHNRDTNWYSMIDAEWPRRKAAMEAWLSPENFDENGKQKRGLKEFHTW